MKRLLFIIPIFVFFIIIILIINYKDYNDYILVKKKNKIEQENECFNDKKVNRLVLYYTNYCPHSSKFKRLVWDNLKSTIKEFAAKNDISLDMQAIDCEQQRYKCSNFDIGGFPEIVLYKENGNVIKFTDKREPSEFLAFVERHLID